jgi:O-antigen ligase
MFGSFNLDKAYQYLLITLAFLLPLTVFGANLIIVIITTSWLISGNYKSKFKEILKNRLLIASILFFLLHLIGLMWTDDLEWGLHIVHKMWYFLLLFPVLCSITKREHIKYYISAFLFAIFLTEVASYLIWFELVEPFKNATVRNPTPFMSHISYNPILAFACYLVLHEIFFNKKLKTIELFAYSFFAISMSFNMFITAGRAGQAMFFAMLAILIFQYFYSQKIKAIVVILIVIGGVFLTAYESDILFKSRISAAVQDVQNYDINKATSVGQRITFTINSFEIIKENLIMGVGTGDFPSEYKKVNLINTPNLPSPSNPHNMYILVLTQLGIIGLISFLSIFYYQIKFSFQSKKKFIRDVGVTLPLLFLLIMLSDSYLLGHYTSLMYIFFSSFLYKDFEKS